MELASTPSGPPREDYALQPGVANLRLSMVTTPNGAGTDEDGWTDTLGGAVDRRVFRYVRMYSDLVLVGAGTIRTGRMPPLTDKILVEPARTAPPRLAVLSNTGHLDWSVPVLSGSALPPLVVVPRALTSAIDVPAAQRAEVLAAGDGQVDLVEAVAVLQNRLGYPRITCEGGPALAGSLVNAGLVDDICLTISAQLLAAPLPVISGISGRWELTIEHAYRVGDSLCVRYGRAERT